MPDRPGIHGKDRPGTSLALPKPKKPTPDNDMDYDFNSPAVSSTPKKEKKKKSKKKSKSRRALMQVDRTFTPKEWQTIARSMDDRRRPYAPKPVGRAVRRGRASGSMGFRTARHGHGASGSMGWGDLRRRFRR